MPELPEVESIRRSVEVHILGRRIVDIDVRWPSVCQGWEGHDFAQSLIGREFTATDRRGKYLILHFDGNWSIIAHMRMTGRLIYYPQGHEPDMHTHLVFRLDRGELHFNDTRKFGRFLLVPTAEYANYPALEKLGPEPLLPQFTPEVFGQGLAGKKKSLKATLLDQTVLAGLGNIYADESLFLARLHPERMACSLSDQEIVALHRAIQTVLQKGIAAQGTSFRDYRNANGEKGEFQEELRVYGRAGQPCYSCGTTLDKKKVAGRTTVYCPRCQVLN